VIDPSGAVAAGRAAHRGLMTDSCTIQRAAAPRTFDRATTDYETTEETVYTGPVRIKIWRGTDEQAGETEMNIQRYYLDFPLGATIPDIRRRDTATVTASLNPALIGRALIITDVETETTDTALRATAEYAQ